MLDGEQPWPAAGTSWSSPEATARLLGRDAGKPSAIPLETARSCARRVQRLRDHLRQQWVGLDETPLGPLADWVLAALIARENLLLVGPPGVAKSEIAVHTFRRLGLRPPEGDPGTLPGPLADARSLAEWWRAQEEREAGTARYFHYLLSRFTQPEELFGPIEISLLRQGVLVRVNFGLLTGPGVRAAFLDEVFKASSSILNALLTLTQERRYFNWGGMRESSLLAFVAASNELPGGLSAGAYAAAAGQEDFTTLYAFLDRFAVRLYVPLANAERREVRESKLGRAFDKALQREARRFVSGQGFEDRDAEDACLNDLLCLGRAALQHEVFDASSGLFDPKALASFTQAFLQVGAGLQQSGTDAEQGSVRWTVSPRKLKALYKVALAHSIVVDDRFAEGPGRASGPGRGDLEVFGTIWDSSARALRDELQVRTRESIAVCAAATGLR